MAEYIEPDITLTRQPVPDHELILALLSQYGFDGFRDEEGGILAYIPVVSYYEKDFQAFMDRHRPDTVRRHSDTERILFR